MEISLFTIISPKYTTASLKNIVHKDNEILYFIESCRKSTTVDS